MNGTGFDRVDQPTCGSRTGSMETGIRFAPLDVCCYCAALGGFTAPPLIVPDPVSDMVSLDSVVDGFLLIR